MRRKTIAILPAVPSNKEKITIYIPSGREIEVFEGALAPHGYVRIRWKAYSNSQASFFVIKDDIQDLTEPIPRAEGASPRWV